MNKEMSIHYPNIRSTKFKNERTKTMTNKLKKEIERIINGIAEKRARMGYPIRFEWELKAGLRQAIEQALSSQRDEFEKIINKIENPYPEDIFPKLSEEEINLVKVILKRNSIISMDRLSAELMRRARETLKEEIKSKLRRKENE